MPTLDLETRRRQGREATARYRLRYPDRVKETQRKDYLNHTARRKANAAKGSQRRRAKLIEIKAAPCKDCGQQYPPYVMDFDHVRGPKLFEIGRGKFQRWSLVQVEIEKCDLVCANCHRIRTHNRKEAA